MANNSYVIGVDYGTDSVRSVVVDAHTGEEMGSAVSYYTRWKKGKYCNPAINQFRQHPLDYLEGLEESITKALAKCPAHVAQHVKGISVDTTGSTIVAVDENGVPLALTKELEENPHAMFILWKDHTAVAEADEINQLAHNWGGEDYTKFSGGVYSSEWFWAKILHTLRTDEQVRGKAYSWVEHCDWIPAVLTGVRHSSQIKRSRCAAGHKAMWHPSFDGLPSEAFLTQLDPLLKGLRANLFTETYTADIKAGNVCKEWAQKLGLSENVAVGIGAFDAHMGAIGAQIEPYTLSKVMGTSTCDMLMAPQEEIGDKLIHGICGQVEGSIAPGMLGMEAGQSAFGDVYAWFEQLLQWPAKHILQSCDFLDEPTKEKILATFAAKIIPELTVQAEQIPIDESGIIALDWLNGRRTPDADQLVKGAIIGLSLGSDAPRIFRALVEATAFGAKKIVDRFIAEGVPIHSVIALGGVAKKSPFVMQVAADVLNMPIKVATSEHTCALGAAMFASVCAEIHPNIDSAQSQMGSGFEKEYQPVMENVKKYETLYERYSRLGDFIDQEIRK